MANVLFDHGRNEFLLGNMNWEVDAFKALLIDTSGGTGGADIDPTTDQNLSDIPSGARVATSPTLTGTTTDGTGIAIADDTVFSAVTGDNVEEVVIYKDTGTESTSTLVVHIDSAGNSLPVDPNSGDIKITWNSRGIFKL